MSTMSNITLAALSEELAELTAAGAASVAQVIGARRSASGVVHGVDTIITTARAIGREDGLRVSVAGGEPVEADLAGWDPASGIAVLRARGPVSVPPPLLSDTEPRPGQIVLALARSWSNVLTVSAGVVAVVGGPLRTGRRGQIPRVIRVTAPMHDGFAGGALIDASGRLTGLTTGSAIRGFGVAIPASIAWAAASQVLTAGTPRRGFVGVGVQPVDLRVSQQPNARAQGLLVVSVSAGSPADAAGLIVGDVLLDFDGQPTGSPDDLLDLLAGRRVGQTIVARILRGGAEREVPVTVADRT
jgi:S1-C subfamily serine protease